MPVWAGAVMVKVKRALPPDLPMVKVWAGDTSQPEGASSRNVPVALSRAAVISTTAGRAAPGGKSSTSSTNLSDTGGMTRKVRG